MKARAQKKRFGQVRAQRSFPLGKRHLGDRFSQRIDARAVHQDRRRSESALRFGEHRFDGRLGADVGLKQNNVARRLANDRRRLPRRPSRLVS